MVADYPEPLRFTFPREVGFDCVPLHNDREWIGFGNMGGGFIPPGHSWTSNPKQCQDDLGSK